MTQIQGEVARLQVMADDLVKVLAISKAVARLAEVVVPMIEDVRAIARAEFDESGSISGENITNVSKVMTNGEDTIWDILRSDTTNDENWEAAKLVSRQFDNIHIMMNAFLTTEGLKCWPPEDPNCP